jgi:hypothetical protein
VQRVLDLVGERVGKPLQEVELVGSNRERIGNGSRGAEDEGSGGVAQLRCGGDGAAPACAGGAERTR